jgi:putative endonuclease
MFYVYLLQSQIDKSYYIGQAEDATARLVLHNLGKIKSTKLKKPWDLLGREEYATRSEARWREYSLKRSSWQRKKFIDSFRKNNNVPVA